MDETASRPVQWRPLVFAALKLGVLLPESKLVSQKLDNDNSTKTYQRTNFLKTEPEGSTRRTSKSTIGHDSEQVSSTSNFTTYFPRIHL